MSGIIYYMLSRQIPVEYRSLGTGRDFRVASLLVQGRAECLGRDFRVAHSPSLVRSLSTVAPHAALARICRRTLCYRPAER